MSLTKSPYMQKYPSLVNVEQVLHHAARKTHVWTNEYCLTAKCDRNWEFVSLPHNYTSGPGKDIRVVKFDDDFGKDVKFLGFQGRGKDVWITLCRGDVHFAKQTAVNCVRNLTAGPQTAAEDRKQDDLTGVHAATGDCTKIHSSGRK